MKNQKKNNAIELDRDYTTAIAEYMISEEGNGLRDEIEKRPRHMVEIFFTVVNKLQITVPFFFNEVQSDFENRLTNAVNEYGEGKRNSIKFIVLKGRQQGFTTVITALQLAYAITRKNFSGFTLADVAENTETIFSDKAKNPYDMLPYTIKPTEKINNRRELHFNKVLGSGLNSRWRVSTAGNKDAGRSKTINFFHGSEVAFWANLKTTLTGLEEAFTKNAIAILESTANGFNYFKTLSDNDNNWELLFYEWWRTPEYRDKFYSSEERSSFMDRVEKANESNNVESEQWVFYRMQWLRDNIKLDLEQLNWYYNKWKDKRENMKQEYPCTPEEAFLSSGRPYFDVEKVYRRIQEIEAGRERDDVKGEFEYEYGYNTTYEAKVIRDERFIDDEFGSITIYEYPVDKKSYVQGADTATDGTDRNVSHILDINGKTMATLIINSDEDLFADQMYCLGKMYNYALTAPEVNHSTHPLKVLMERQYPNLYTRENPDDAIAQFIIPKYGFRTSQGNRQHILGQLRTLVRENVGNINDLNTLKEMLTFVYNKNGKPAAEEGEHDDHIMAYAISLAIKENISDFSPSVEDYLEGVYMESELEDLGYSKYEIRQYKEGFRIKKRS